MKFLEWRNEFSVKDEKFLAKLKKQGEDVPALKRKPQLDIADIFLWRCWNEISRTRSSSGFGGNPVLYSEIVAWLTLRDLFDPEFVRMITDTVIHLDEKWLSLQAEKRDNADSPTSD